jgi:hypothetical protein
MIRDFFGYLTNDYIIFHIIKKLSNNILDD